MEEVPQYVNLSTTSCSVQESLSIIVFPCRQRCVLVLGGEAICVESECEHVGAECGLMKRCVTNNIPVNHRGAVVYQKTNARLMQAFLLPARFPSLNWGAKVMKRRFLAVACLIRVCAIFEESF